MKARAERMTECAVKEILAIIQNRRQSIDEIVAAMDETHSAEELAQNRAYCALVSAFNNLKFTEERMTGWLTNRLSIEEAKNNIK